MCIVALVSLGCDLDSTLIFNESCPTQINHLFLVDVVGVSVLG